MTPLTSSKTKRQASKWQGGLIQPPPPGHLGLNLVRLILKELRYLHLQYEFKVVRDINEVLLPLTVVQSTTDIAQKTEQKQF